MQTLKWLAHLIAFSLVLKGTFLNIAAADEVRDALVASDPALQLTFSGLPKVIDERTANMVVRYSYIARGWWIESKCSFMEPVTRLSFRSNVAVATKMMRSVFSADFAQADAQKYSEIIQMYSLQYASANKFFGCKDAALEEAEVAYVESKRWAATLDEARQATDK